LDEALRQAIPVDQLVKSLDTVWTAVAVGVDSHEPSRSESNAWNSIRVLFPKGFYALFIDNGALLPALDAGLLGPKPGLGVAGDFGREDGKASMYQA
jgi:hypothetical protein